MKIATFGAGCFWCVEAVFQRLGGVHSTTSGYMGGQTSNPTYEDICSGTSGHAEVVQISFDDSVISYEELLEVLWSTHDPTTLNQQGADKGTQYRSVIFYHDEHQKQSAEQSKNNVATEIWDDPIVTEIIHAETFYKAEDYHSDYFDGHQSQPYCSIVINPKIAKLKKKFANKLKKNYGK